MSSLSALDTFIKSNPDSRELKRAIAVKMTLKRYKHQQICEFLGVSSGFVSKWKKRFLAHGVDSLHLAYQGFQPYLSIHQKLQILNWLNTKSHTSLSELISYIQQQFGVVFKSQQSYYDLFSEARFSYIKPKFRSSKRDEDKIDQWKQERFPEIVREAQKRNAYLAFADEAGFMLTPTICRVWAPKGKTPVKYIGDEHERISVISAVTVSPKMKRLGLYFNLLPDNKNFHGKEIVEFLYQLRNQIRHPITLCWDSFSIHHGEPVEDYLSKYPQIVSELMPPYAHELNPDEGVWQYVKCARSTDYPTTDLSELRQFVTEELEKLKNRPDLLASFIRRTKLPLELPDSLKKSR